MEDVVDREDAVDDEFDDLGFESASKLSKDLREAAKTLTVGQARYLVDTYYQIQRDRMRSGSQVMAMGESKEPHAVVRWLNVNTLVLENQIRRALNAYSLSKLEGEWARSIVGVGPVIGAGLLAYIDVRKAATAGAIWRFAGLDPTLKWGKKEKRPWNAKLKVLCWKLGESFKKTSNHPQSIYGKVYRERKVLEVERNNAGAFKQLAAEALAERHFRDTATRDRYESGKLPDGRLDLRAERYAVKLFLAHYHHVLYNVVLGEDPPKPYILTQEGHTHYIAPPNWPMR